MVKIAAERPAVEWATLDVWPTCNVSVEGLPKFVNIGSFIDSYRWSGRVILTFTSSNMSEMRISEVLVLKPYDTGRDYRFKIPLMLE